MQSWFFLLSCCALVAISTSAPISSLPVRLCVVNAAEEAKCKALKARAQELNLQPEVECVVGLNKYDCMAKIESGSADMGCYWSMDTYVADKDHNLVPILAERHIKDAEDIAYFALAVIHKDDDTIHSLEDLRGKRSCHTGYGRHVGWAYPTAQFVSRGFFNQSGDCINNVANMAQFFSKSCVSNANKAIFHEDGKWENICELCGSEGDDFCTSKDKYASYTGSLKCLVDKRGDVAFIKDTTWAETVKERPEIAGKEDEYRLLCLDGSRKTLDKYKECNWGKIPERACLTSSQQSSEHIAAIQDLFLKLQDDSTFNLFESQSYGGKFLIFSDYTKQLAKIDDRSVKNFLGDYMFVREHHNVCPVPAARWCVISSAEMTKCKQWQDAALARFIQPGLQCVQGTDTADCMKKIQQGQCDLMTLDGGDIYTGGKDYGLQVILNEERGGGNAKYYAVAVVKKSNNDINFNNLKGKRSCHTGIGRTAGWNIPAGILLHSGQIKMPSNCNIAEALANFFSGSCAPGANNPAYNPSTLDAEKLCSICAGQGDDKCSRSENEPYYGYTGAFRCLASGDGDVAFVKHVTPLENTDGNNKDKWAEELRSEDFELLCPDGTRKPVTEYKSCNLARVAAHAVVTSGDKSNDAIRQYKFLLKLSAWFFGDDDSVFQLFKSGPGAKDLLFTDSTKDLEVIPSENRAFDKYLGDMTKVFDQINQKNCQASHN